MQIFGSDTPAIVQYLLAFVIVLGVLAVFAAVLRRITGNRPRPGYTSASARHRQQRLGVIDAVDIDAQRQLLLLRRDNVEHLVLIGGPNDLLVESGIGRLPYRAPIQTQSPVQMSDGAPETARLEQPVPQPGAGLAAVATAGAAGVHAGLDQLASSERVPPRQAQPQVPPPPPRSLATPVAPRPAPDEDFLSSLSPEVKSEGVAAVPAPVPEPSPVRSREPAKGPFSAVARHLEEALRRPFGAVRPAPVTGIDLDDVAPPAARPVDRDTLAGDVAGRDLADKGGVAGDAAGKAAAADLPSKVVGPGEAGRKDFEPGNFESKNAESKNFEPGDNGADGAGIRGTVGEKPTTVSADTTRSGDRGLRDRIVDTGPAASRPAGPGTAAGPAAPPPPPQARLPLPPAVPARETGDIAGRPREADPDTALGPLAQILQPTSRRPVGDALPPVSPLAPPSVTPPAERPVEPAAERRPEETGGDAAASAGVTPRGTRIIGPSEPADPADTFKVPEALKTPPATSGEHSAAKDPFDLSSLENIEAEFARLLGRLPSGKDK